MTKIINPKTNKWISMDGKLYNKLLKENVKFDYTKMKDMEIDRENISWVEKKPKSKKERQFIKENCGDFCFLLSNQNKFPICNKTLPCKINCKGLKAASSRAGQWKYKEILEKSKALTKELDCYKKK